MPDAGHFLAHVTESRMRAPLDDPSMSRFLFVFATVLRTAAASPGFRWQLENRDRAGHPVLRPDDPLHVVSVSVWTDYAALHAFVYRSAHGQVLLHRHDWFAPAVQPSTALWWVAPDHVPAIDEATSRLAHLRRYGPSPRAFTLTRRFQPDGRARRRGAR